jgi:hypothetical protein
MVWRCFGLCHARKLVVKLFVLRCFAILRCLCRLSSELLASRTWNVDSAQTSTLDVIKPP